MLDLNKPVQTRDGRPVRILTTDANIRGWENATDTIAGLVTEDGSEVFLSWQADGAMFGDTHPNDPNDLINVPDPATETYHVLSGFSPGYTDLALAIDHAQHRGAMAVIKVTSRGSRADDVELVYARK